MIWKMNNKKTKRNLLYFSFVVLVLQESIYMIKKNEKKENMNELKNNELKNNFQIFFLQLTLKT